MQTCQRLFSKPNQDDNYDPQTSQTHRLNRVEPNIWMSKLQDLHEEVESRTHL